MKSIFTKATLAILCVAALGACGKKKGNSAVAAAPAGYTTCPATGINPYYNPAVPGSLQTCTPGQVVYATGSAYGQQIQYGQQYGQQPYGYGQRFGYGQQQYDVCSQYYGPGFYTVVIGGQYQCMGY